MSELVERPVIVELGCVCQDNVGTQWLAVQEIRHYQSPKTLKYIMVEQCLPTRGPRTCIVDKDGTNMQGPNVLATTVLMIVSHQEETTDVEVS